MLLFPEKKDYPKDYFYHRTSSPTYRKYLEGCGLCTFDVQKGPQFFWRKKIFGSWFGVVKWERIDEEPDVEYIKKMTGLSHAFIAWIPYSRTRAEVPKLWKRLWFTDHFEETGFARLNDRGQMTDDKSVSSHPFSSWNDRAKRALKKFEKSGCTVKVVTPEEFASAFRQTKVKYWGSHKSVYIGYYKKMVSIHADTVRQWVAYAPDGTPIAGLATHDYLGTHSVHLVAFTNQKYYDTQAGTGVMGEWFRDSHEKGLTYLSVDHIRNLAGPGDQKGYTEFKENFITTRLSFREAYFRFF